MQARTGILGPIPYQCDYMLVNVAHPTARAVACCAVQFTDEHGEVCPANWTPGAATMKADPKESLVSTCRGGGDSRYVGGGFEGYCE